MTARVRPVFGLTSDVLAKIREEISEMDVARMPTPFGELVIVYFPDCEFCAKTEAWMRSGLCQTATEKVHSKVPRGKKIETARRRKGYPLSALSLSELDRL